MQRLWPIVLLAGVPVGLLAKGDSNANLAPSVNVNSRYTVESVGVTSADVSKLSNGLRDRIDKLVGTNFDQELLNDIAARIRRELSNLAVNLKVTRGTTPEHLRVIFEVEEKKDSTNVAVPRFVYNSQDNFTFGMDASVKRGNNIFSAGALTDNDELIERFSGVRGGYERDGFAGGRVKVKFEAESWRSQWNPAVKPEGNLPGLYRSRFQIQPTATILIFRPLTLQLGVSLERMEFSGRGADSTPCLCPGETSSVRHELSSAAVSTLRFQRRWELAPASKLDVDMSYGIRSASKSLGSSLLYTRHHWVARYALQSGREELSATFQAGFIDGHAPLFERFTLGNSTTLRGWSKYDIAPFGADRMAHASVEYRYRIVRVIYDTGSAWLRNGPMVVRHSAAIGVTSGNALGLTAMVAFPLRDGHIEPVFIAGINF